MFECENEFQYCNNIITSVIFVQHNVSEIELNVSYFAVVFTDTESPDIACPYDMSTSTDEGNSTALVMWKQPNATDNSGHVKEVTCYPQAGSAFPIGQTNILCEAVDDAGNKATCYFNVNVSGK